MKILHYLHDFRTMPFFIAFSMTIGIGIGKLFGISNYELTPPIEAIKTIFRGSYDFTIGNTLALGIVVGLFLMIYPAMTNVRLADLGTAFRSPKQMLIVAFFNYAIAPFFMFALAELFLRGNEDLHTGLVLYGIAPCIAMVIVFTFLASGNMPLALVLVAFNSIAQMILLPFYAKLLIGNVHFDVLVVGESVVLYLGLPLALGFLTRHISVQRMGERGFERLREALDTLSVIGLLFTLIVLFALKGDLIVADPLIVLRMAIPMTIFFFVMFNTVYLVGWRAGLNYRDAVAVAFNSTGRDFEIAIAIAITAFSPPVAVATVVGPLIEVPIMLALVWIAIRTEQRLFAARAVAPEAVAFRALYPAVAREDDSSMFRKILFPTDLSTYASAVMGRVIDLKGAGVCEAVLLHVVHQDEVISGSTVDLHRLERLKAEGQSKLETMARAIEAAEIKVKVRVEVGIPAREIVRVAKEEDASLIAIGSHGRGALQGFLLGSVTERVLHASTRAVWAERFHVIQENGDLKERHWGCAQPFGKILCPTDWSEPATYALEYAKQLRFAGAKEVVVLHVQEPVIMQQRSSEQIAEFDRRDRERLAQVGRAFEDLGLKASLRLAHGAPLTKILEVAEQEGVSSIIMGSHGRSMAAEMVLGSVAENVVRRSMRPVLVVRRAMVT